MRPPRPVPATPLSSTPCSFARCCTTGESQALLRAGPVVARGDFASGVAKSSSATPPARSASAVAILARRVPTSTVVPSLTRISCSVPVAGLGMSVTILSVSPSQMGSSACTASPGCLSHLRIVPSTTDTPSWGMATSVVEEVLAGIADALDAGQHGLFERGAEGDRDVGGGDAADRTVELLERALGD